MLGFSILLMFGRRQKQGYLHLAGDVCYLVLLNETREAVRKVDLQSTTA